MKQVMAVESRASERERGAVIVLAGIFLVVLVGLLAIVFNVGMHRMIQSELQSAADAAAHAGAGALCSQPDCYTNALTAAFNAFKAQRVGGDSTSFDFSVGSNGRWISADGNLRVTIQRGRWWPGAVPAHLQLPINKLHQNDRFEPFDVITDPTLQPVLSPDTTPWQTRAESLNTPEELAANAVYFRVERNTLFLWSGLFGGGDYDVLAETYAVGGNVDGDVCVAPFAIPACALIDENGDFDREIACGRDRFFTDPDRYCSNPADCSAPDPTWPTSKPNGLPGFWYSPTGSSGGGGGMRQTFALRNTEIFAGSYGPNQHYDHFGLVGLPTAALTSTPITEDQIRTTVFNPTQNPGACVPARIGDPFSVLPGGLRNLNPAGNPYPRAQSTNNLIWDTIVGLNSVVADDGAGGQYIARVGRNDQVERLPFNDAALSLGGTFLTTRRANQNTDHGVGACNSNRTYYREVDNDVDRYVNQTGPASGTLDCVYRDSGTQNGTTDPDPGTPTVTQILDPLLSWNFESQFSDPPTPTGNTLASCVPDASVNGAPNYRAVAGDSLNVWDAVVPVIAQSAASTQACGVGAGAVDPALDPTLPYVIVGFVRVQIYDTDIGQLPPAVPNGPTTLPSDSFKNTHYDWSFVPRNAGAPQSCNLVRARIHCDTELIPSNDFSEVKSPKLVQ